MANAGEDQYIQLPERFITLSGLRSTDDKEIVSYTWSLLDGPDVDVSDTNSPELQLYNLQEGTYVIELEVMDALGQKDTDEVTVYVLPGEFCFLRRLTTFLTLYSIDTPFDASTTDSF